METILKDNIAALKSSSVSSQLRTSDYLELCDDAHRCLVLYTRATFYPATFLQNGERAAPAEEHSPQEEINIALSWSPKAIQSKNGSFVKICSPLSH